MFIHGESIAACQFLCFVRASYMWQNNKRLISTVSKLQNLIHKFKQNVCVYSIEKLSSYTTTTLNQMSINIHYQ